MKKIWWVSFCNLSTGKNCGLAIVKSETNEQAKSEAIAISPFVASEVNLLSLPILRAVLAEDQVEIGKFYSRDDLDAKGRQHFIKTTNEIRSQIEDYAESTIREGN